MLVYPSEIDQSSTTLRYLSGLPAAQRREPGTRWRRLPPARQALPGLAQVRCGHTYAQLAAGFGVGMAPVYRYIGEAVEVLAALTPDLAAAARGAERKAFVILGGTLRPIDRVADDPPYYSGCREGSPTGPG